MIYCHNCNEKLEGDGYQTVLHCPNADDWDYYDQTPDDDPVYCTTPHWADDHILENFDTGEFEAFDEAGLLHGTYDTRQQARSALDYYTQTL